MSGAITQGGGLRPAPDDSGLLWLERQFTVLRDAMDALDESRADYDARFSELADRLGTIEDTMRETPAQTPAGIAAKLRQVYRNGMSGAVDDEHPCADMVKVAIADAERLAEVWP